MAVACMEKGKQTNVRRSQPIYTKRPVKRFDRLTSPWQKLGKKTRWQRHDKNIKQLQKRTINALAECTAVIQTRKGKGSVPCRCEFRKCAKISVLKNCLVFFSEFMFDHFKKKGTINFLILDKKVFANATFMVVPLY